MLSEVGELFFAVLITYMGALELAFVGRHLIHSIFHHINATGNDEESLRALQEQTKNAITEAEAKELYGLKAMKDGVLYKDGFRVDPELLKNDEFRRELIGSSSRNSIENESNKNESYYKDRSERKEKDRELIGDSGGSYDQNVTKHKSSRNDIQNANFTESNKNESYYKRLPEGKEIERELIGDSEGNYDQNAGKSKNTTHNVSSKTREFGVPSSDTDELQEVYEEPCIKKEVKRLISPSNASHNELSLDNESNINERITKTPQTVRTQISQMSSEKYLAKDDHNKSEDSSSNEPMSSSHKSSSLSNQDSSSIETTPIPEIQFGEYEREEPDGQDVPERKYSDDYLRSLDGIKYRPLVRDDGTGRRRAFKKRSSIDSTSSRESRASREEELKMFTSLEEEEFEAIRKGDSEFVPIRYTSEPSLKVKKHHKRHRKSPIKDMRLKDDEGESRSSLEIYDEQDTINPWGDVVPENYKNTEFWKREKGLSIDEEESEEFLRSLHTSDNKCELKIPGVKSSDSTSNIPKLSSFEEATNSQHEDVINIVKSKESHDIEREDHKSTSDHGKSTTSGKNVSKDIGADYDDGITEASILLPDTPHALHDTQKSLDTDELIACKESDDYTRSIRKSPLKSSDTDFEGFTSIQQGRDKFRRIGNVETPSLNMFDKINKADTSYTDNQQEILPMDYHQPSDYRQQHDLMDHPVDSSQLAEGIKRKSPSPYKTMPAIPKIEIENTQPSGHRQQRDLVDHPVDNSQLGEGINRKSSPSPYKIMSATPKIEIENTSHEAEHHKSEIPYDKAAYEEDEKPGILMEGISDFYDFSTSINRSRSRSLSTEKSFRKSKSPSRASSAGLYRYKERFPVVPLNAKGMEGVSDFYDFNLRLNRTCYGHPADGNTSHYSEQTSTDLLLKNHDLTSSDQSKNGLGLVSIQIPKNEMRQKADEGGTINDIKNDNNYAHSQTASPSTPGSEKSFSSIQRDIEQIKDEYRSKNLIRSTYPGESMDFSDNFEALREEARHFQRSRSRSRSIEYDAHRNLQDKILEEISRTTINYQDFSLDINKKFLEKERRVSDSMLLEKPEIVIQIEDKRKDSTYEDDDDILGILEAEEYHHFRRFSLNQEYQIEEYPSDDYVYVEKIAIRTKTGIRSWTREDYYDPEDRPKDNRDTHPLNSVESFDDSDRAEAEDIESGSDDERQTVVEVDDELEDDVFDYDKTGHEIDDFINNDYEDDIVNHNEGNAYNWKEQIAISRIPEEQEDESSVNIEEISEDKSSNFDESDMENPHGSIESEMSMERNTKIFNIGDNDDSASVRTEDLIEEILNQEDEKYNWRHKTDRLSAKESVSSFIDHESNLEAYMATTNSTTTSTRLRSRYGIGTSSTSYLSYDIGENYSTETTPVQPKKEYNWRKNFKLDEDEETTVHNVKSKKLCFDIEDLTRGEEDEASMEEKDEKPANEYLDIRKFSLGGESITLYSRSPDRIQDFEDYDKSNDGSWNQEETESSNDSTSAIDKSNEEVGKDKKKIKNSEENIEENQQQVEEGESKTDSTAALKKTREDEAELKIEKSQEQTIELYNDTKENDYEMAREPSVESIKKSKKKKNKKKIGKNSPERVSLEKDACETISLEDEPISNKKKIKKKRKDTEEELENTKKSPSPSVSSTKIQQSTNMSPKIASKSELVEKTSSSPKRSLTPIQSKASPSSSVATSTTATATASKKPSSSENKKPKPSLERRESSGVYELIKDGSMYPWF